MTAFAAGPYRDVPSISDRLALLGIGHRKGRFLYQREWFDLSTGAVLGEGDALAAMRLLEHVEPLTATA